MERQSATQKQKFVAFKTAFENISAFRKKKNYIGAYVVAFSVIEDRLRAMYVARYIAENDTQPTSRKVNGSFSDIVKMLVKNADIPDEVSVKLIEEAKLRNKLIHAAMWKTDSFTDESISQVVSLARRIDNCRLVQKRLLENS